MIDQLLVNLTLSRPRNTLLSGKVAIRPHRLRVHAHFQTSVKATKSAAIPLVCNNYIYLL